MRRFWEFRAQAPGAAARTGLVAGIVAIVVATVAAGYFILRPDYQVLFADISPQDTAAMTVELDRLKIPYVLSDRGDTQGAGTILVDKRDVYKTRLRLMGQDIPLHGGVGFELFNNNDLGMTEFAQKINYQRALQGELTRTILSLTEIRDARVLLALPEQGLFKQNTQRPTASITLTLKRGQDLQPAQVNGIQRLVSSAVPGIAVQDVTIVDQSGVALTRAAGDPDSATGSSRLDLKKDTETYLARKAIQVLDKALGVGEATASVDVTLNMDRVQSSLDELVGAPGRSGSAASGYVTKERETTHEIGAPLNTAAGTTAGNANGPQGGSSQHEVEYAMGHRVEQVIGQPGSVRQIQVAIVVRRALSGDQLERLRQVVAASVGASFDRGDTVIVQTAQVAGMADAVADAAAPGSPVAAGPAAARATGAAVTTTLWWLIALVAVFLLGLLLRPLVEGRRRAVAAPPLSDAERRAMLARLQAWMDEHPQAGDDPVRTAVPLPGTHPGVTG